MSPIDTSIYHLIFLADQIERSFNGLGQFSKLKIEKTESNSIMESTLFEVTVSIILIRTKSLMDEYETQFLKIQDPRIKYFKEQVQPIWDKIKQWNEIDSFRNNILAHNLRDRKSGYKSIFLIKSFESYNIPNTIQEILLLVDCIKLFRDYVYNTFHQNYDKAISYRESVTFNDQRTPSVLDHKNEFKQLVAKLKNL